MMIIFLYVTIFPIKKTGTEMLFNLLKGKINFNSFIFL